MTQLRAFAAFMGRFQNTEGLVGLGLLICGAAWMGLIVSMLARLVGANASPMNWLSFYVIILCAIITGMGLALVGALRSSFGVMEHFFKEILQRASQRAPQPAYEPRRRDGVRQRGVIGNRPYILYDDGTVAVETLLGVRLFKSFEEAQEFIGA